MVKAKKSLGQHFLINKSLIAQIIDLIEHETTGLPLLEVGPGTGAITDGLIHNENYSAVEIDREAHAFLCKKYPEHADRIKLGNFLKFSLKNELDPGEYALVGNFPYNISTQIIFKLLENVDRFPVMIGMFQREVALRILSPHGSKVYGILSVLTACFYEGKHVIRVSPGSFSPPPKVDSSVILLRRKEDYKERLEIFKPLKSVVKLAFNQRRKMLRTSLKSLELGAELKEIGLDDKRPEHLDLTDFIRITKLYLER